MPLRWSPTSLAVSGAVVRSEDWKVAVGLLLEWCTRTVYYVARGSMKKEERERDLSFLGDPFLPTPSIASRYRISRYLRSLLPGSKVSPSHEYPPRDGAHCMLPMQVCSVYMSVVRVRIDVEASSTRVQAQIEA